MKLPFFSAISCSMLMHLLVQSTYGQINVPLSGSSLIKPIATEFIKTDSGIIIKCKFINSCKTYSYLTSFIPNYTNVLVSPLYVIDNKNIKPALLKVHGNISYDFFYRSKIDNPFSQKDLQQHTEKINLDIIIKEKYPLRVAFSLRQSNSPFFKNFADVNLHFDPSSYRKNIKQQLADKLSKALSNTKDINAIEALISDKEKELSKLKNWVQSPATLQKIIEEREVIYAQQEKLKFPSKTLAIPEFTVKTSTYFKNKLSADPLSANKKIDKARDTFAVFLNSKKQEIDSLSTDLKLLKKRGDSLKNTAEKNISAIKQQIYKARDAKELSKIASSNGIEADDKYNKGLGAIRSFSIGRSMVNYTELTAQDITITGVNIEYNPSYYAAFAAGKINYQFRDFYNKNVKTSGQYLVLGRIGTGNPDRQALILTVFKGEKNSVNPPANNLQQSGIGIIGYSVESIFRKDDNTGLSFEVAKSTKPYNGNIQGDKQMGELWAFSDQSNLGVNIKAKTIIAATNTKLSGFYRKTGQSFQSFSLFSYNTDQTAWLARADQYFFKDKLTASAMLRRNDFTNPFTEKTYKTSTVFKSFLLNVRLPKYPVLSLGYYPGTQLFLVDRETVREDAYYLLNSSLSYSYPFKIIRMNSLVVYNRYFNKATDSGFVLNKGISYYGMQTFLFKKFQLQAGFAYNSQVGLTYSTTEASCDYSFRQSLKFGVGAKYNKVSGGAVSWGERAQVMMEVPTLGRLQFQYEKSYLPTTSHSLFPVEIGRVSWYKYF